MKNCYILISSIIITFLALSMSSCIKKDFDAPPDKSGFDPNLTVTTTLAQLQSLPQNVQITDDLVVAGIVGMDDKEGNYYKKIAFQDETGGMEILLDQSNLYNDYPVGRKIYVKLKGLYFGYSKENPQIGYTPDGGGALSNIPFGIIDDYVVKASFPNSLMIDTVTLQQLVDPSTTKQYLNKIIAIKRVEFADVAIRLPFADPSAINSATSRKLQECSSPATVDLRTSGFAKFQPELTPDGSGILVALYTRYNDFAQLTIRNTADVSFSNPRCSGTTPVGPVTISIDSLRKRFTGTAIVITGTTINGVVTSDRNAGNVLAQNVVIQDGEKGIMVRFASGGSHTFNLGDSLVVMLNGVNLEEYRGLLQINGTPLASATKVGTGTVVPKVLTIAVFNSNPEKYESVLVKILNATVSGGGTYNGTRTLGDGTGTIALFTSSAASFVSTSVPAVPKSFTGIIGQYNTTYQLQLRNILDVQ